jgi:hypothetical protein
MRFKLHHPLWTHLPALACIAINIGLLLSTELPARVPVHFTHGLPDNWGSPLTVWMTMIGIPLLLVIGSAAIDERCARMEQKRRFNFASLLDELLVAFMVGMNFRIVPQLSRPEPLVSGQGLPVLLFTVGAVALAALLEIWRPYRPSPVHPMSVDVASLAQSIQPQFQPGGRWLYWEKNDPLWWRCLSILCIVFCFGGAMDTAGRAEWGTSGFLALLAVGFASTFGGLDVTVTPAHFTIRPGSFGWPLLRLKLVNIKAVEVLPFDPLSDTGGWGMYRYSPSRRAWCFALGGGRGVMIHTKKGRRFLLSSNTPAKLAAATEAARIAATQSLRDAKPD